MIDMLIKNRHAAMDALNVLSTYPPTWKVYFIYVCVGALHGVGTVEGKSSEICGYIKKN